MSPLLADAIRRKRRMHAAHRAERWLRVIVIGALGVFLAVHTWRAIPRMFEERSHVALEGVGRVKIEGKCEADRYEAVLVRIFKHGERYYATCVGYNPSGGWGQ